MKKGDEKRKKGKIYIYIYIFAVRAYGSSNTTKLAASIERKPRCAHPPRPVRMKNQPIEYFDSRGMDSWRFWFDRLDKGRAINFVSLPKLIEIESITGGEPSGLFWPLCVRSGVGCRVREGWH